MTTAVIEERSLAVVDEPSSVVLSSPARPMAVAREWVASSFTAPDGLTLRFHRGLPYRWNGTHWAEIPTRDLRSLAYAFLEHALYSGEHHKLIPWAPNRRKVTDVLEAIEAIVL